MAYNGAGVYVLPTGNPVVTGTVISSAVQNATTSDIAAALTNCVTRDGQSPPTANLPMGGKKLTNVGAPTADGEAIVQGAAASVASLTTTGAVSGASVTATGAVTGASVTATGAVAGATLASSGNASVGADLTVTGNATLNGNVMLGNAAIDIISVPGATSFAESASFAKGLTAGNAVQASGTSFDWAEKNGSWTPVLSFGGASTGITYLSRGGWYSRYGNILFYGCTISLNSKGSSTGAAVIDGLPYSSGNGGIVQFFVLSNMNTATGNPFGVQFGSTTSTAIFVQPVAPIAASSALTDTAFNNSSRFQIHGFTFL